MSIHEPPKLERKVLNDTRTADPLASLDSQQEQAQNYTMPNADKKKQAKDINMNDYTPPTQKF